jgi:hypothetical protein
MQVKWPDQTLDQAFGLPEVLVAVSTSRLSCKRAGETRTLMRFGIHLENLGLNVSFERYLRFAVDTPFVASVAWWALFRTETAYWPRFLSGSTFGTTTVRWKASQFSRDS